VLLQGEPRDAAVNFDTYWILQRQCGFSATARNSCIRQRDSDRSNAEITHSTVIFTAVTQNHGDSRKMRKSRHTSKITVKATIIVHTWLSYSA